MVLLAPQLSWQKRSEQAGFGPALLARSPVRSAEMSMPGERRAENGRAVDEFVILR
jgi:hypothetical protein